jgi:transposase-like protein
MSVISSANVQRRIPEEYLGIDVNFCKTPGCPNFGVPPARTSRQGRPSPSNPAPSDNYKLSGSGGVPGLYCQICQKTTTLKSNRGVHEEFARVSSFLKMPTGIACRTEGCASRGLTTRDHPESYRLHGTTSSGARRILCKACRKTFTVSPPAARHRKPHENLTVFRLLVNQTPISRMCEIADLSPTAIYGKIDFLHRQCLAFAAERESQLPNISFERLYLCTDRQDYIVNWGDRKARRTVQLTSVGTADLLSGYVFAMTPNFDADLDPDSIEAAAAAIGDNGQDPPFREHARHWLQSDYAASVMRATAATAAKALQPKSRRGESLDEQIQEREAQVSARDDLDTAELLDEGQALPKRGMQIHAEYVLYGHFHYLRHLLRGARKLRFFLDQDAGMKQACLAAFTDGIRDRWVDVFHVAIAKNRTVDEKRAAMAAVQKRLDEALIARGKDPKTATPTEIRQVRIAVMRELIAGVAEASPVAEGKLLGQWIGHPFPSMAEPEKKVAILTDLGSYGEEDLDRLAHLYHRASLHAIDRFFMLVRRRLRLLERPISPTRRARRVWHGYAPYDPAMVGKCLDIFRVWHNWCFVGNDGLTPAERLGLAKGKVRIDDIVYFDPQA